MHDLVSSLMSGWMTLKRSETFKGLASSLNEAGLKVKTSLAPSVADRTGALPYNEGEDEDDEDEYDEDEDDEDEDDEEEDDVDGRYDEHGVDNFDKASMHAPNFCFFLPQTYDYCY